MNKGLHFVPNFKKEKFEFLVDFHQFCRKLRIKMFFANKDIKKSETTVPEKLRKKSKFDPDITNSMLDAFQQM